MSDLVNLILGSVKGLIFGITFLLLWYLSGISLGLWGVVVFFAITLLTTLLSEKISIPKFPTNKKTKLLWIVVAVLSLVVAIMLLVASSSVYASILSVTKDSKDKRYHYGGNIIFVEDYYKNEVLQIDGEAFIFNNKTSKKTLIFGPFYNQYPELFLSGNGRGSITIEMENDKKKYKKEIVVNGPFEIEFGTTDGRYTEQDVIYFVVNNIDETDTPYEYFDTNGEYSIRIYFSNGSYTVKKRVLGA